MKSFVLTHLGYDVYVWTTGKYEAYFEKQPTKFCGRTLESVLEQIEKVKDEV